MARGARLRAAVRRNGGPHPPAPGVGRAHPPHPHTAPRTHSIPGSEHPPFAGCREIERRIKSLVRWNALAMVVKANKADEGIGGHISTYASAATLYEVGFHHF